MTAWYPGASELLEAVREFLANEVQPQDATPSAFHVRVAANVLAIVQRETETGQAALEAEERRLTELLAVDGDLEELNAELCRRLRAGEMDYNSPELLDHLRQTTMDRLAIDNPRYATYRRCRELDR